MNDTTVSIVLWLLAAGSAAMWAYNERDWRRKFYERPPIWLSLLSALTTGWIVVMALHA